MTVDWEWELLVVCVCVCMCACVHTHMLWSQWWMSVIHLSPPSGRLQDQSVGCVRAKGEPARSIWRGKSWEVYHGKGAKTILYWQAPYWNSVLYADVHTAYTHWPHSQTTHRFYLTAVEKTWHSYEIKSGSGLGTIHTHTHTLQPMHTSPVHTHTSHNPCTHHTLTHTHTHTHICHTPHTPHMHIPTEIQAIQRHQIYYKRWKVSSPLLELRVSETSEMYWCEKHEIEYQILIWVYLYFLRPEEERWLTCREGSGDYWVLFLVVLCQQS